MLPGQSGHDVGDRVLVEAGRRLFAATRAIDTVCRIGGDEFVVLGAPVDGPRELVHRIASLPPLTVPVEGGRVAVTSSIGSVMAEPDESLDDALRRADAAMYRAKRRRSGGLLFDPPGRLPVASGGG